MPKISVIIPVYNTEKYIEKCLESLAKQTMQDFEVIVVNDGSTDNSKSIIKEYMKNSELNIKYLEKENGGLASARNYGVERALGKYISFLDSDDYLDESLFSELEKYMDKDIDLIKFKMKTVNEEGKILEKLDGPVFDVCTGEEGYKKLCTTDKYMDPACIYLYRKEFFMENNFKYKLRYHEDFGLTSLIIIQAKTFVSTNTRILFLSVAQVVYQGLDVVLIGYAHGLRGAGEGGLSFTYGCVGGIGYYDLSV